MSAKLSFTVLATAVLATAIPSQAQPEQSAWQVLKQGLTEKNVDKHRQALTAIGAIGNTARGRELVEQALRDENDPLIRQTAAAVLGQMKAIESIRALKAALEDPEGEVQFAAAKALWDLGDKSGRVLIEDVLTGQQKTTEGIVNGMGRKAQRKVHDPKGMAILGLKEASGAVLGPFNLGIVATEQAFKDNATAPGRTLAISVLTEQCDTETVRLLDWAFTYEKSWAVRAAAAKGLSKCGTAAESVPKLETALSDSNMAVKTMAASSIIRLTLKPETRQAGAE
jgi:HEAT repeat protein